jgi:hypothetical protein
LALFAWFVSVVAFGVLAWLDGRAGPAFAAVFTVVIAGVSFVLVFTVVYVVGRGQRRGAMEALNAARQDKPLLAFMENEHGLVFFTTKGFFVASELAFQRYRSPIARMAALEYLSEHVLALQLNVNKIGQKQIHFALPSTITPPEAQRAVETIRECCLTG